MTSRRKAWLVTVVAFLASIALAINQFKVPPLMQVLMADLGAGMAVGALIGPPLLDSILNGGR